METRTLCHRLHFDSSNDLNINESFDVEYYLLETVNNFQEHEKSVVDVESMYGVEIRKTQKGILQESSSDYNISRSEDRAKSLIELLVSNSVTPESFEYIMVDNK